ncbi:MAG TPA: cytochrome c-type biogenesis protein [Casimicrobiaceae bacterium]|nr:cytochrome c-type biogenesis protein [Casimicrobiaceae bacterium]
MTTRALVFLAVAFTVTTAIPQALTDIEFEGRLKRLESELRCLVCQNQTLADSNAPLAEDLRREVRSLATSGKSDAEIKQYLVARYGDFVLYNPPLQRNTWLLWIGPFGLLLGGGIVWYAILRRRKGAAAEDDDDGAASSALPEEAVARARQAIYEEP